MRGCRRQRASYAGVHPSVCRGARPVLWQRLRARSCLQLLQSLLDPRRNGHRRRIDRDKQVHDPGGAKVTELLSMTTSNI